MRPYAILLCVTLLCAPGFGRPQNQSAAPKLQLRLYDKGPYHDQSMAHNFVYAITHPEFIRAAWIEVLDRPLVLDRKSVAVQAKGDMKWDWDTSKLNGWEQPQDQLVLSIWDPNGETIYCEGTIMYAKSGGRGLVNNCRGAEDISAMAASGPIVHARCAR
jgi:hypothetical protein